MLWALRAYRLGRCSYSPALLRYSDVPSLQKIGKDVDQDANIAAERLARELASTLKPAQILLLSRALRDQITPEQTDDAIYDELWSAFAIKGQMTE